MLRTGFTLIIYTYSFYIRSCLQWLNSIRWHVFWQCVFNFFEGFIVNGVVNVILPALEKRYDLSSSKSAIIASANDFGAFVLLIVVGYFGERRHKPKLMGIGVLVMALGCLLFSLPQFVGGKYAYTISGIVLLMFHNLDYAEIIFRWLENISSFY